jgi:DNA-binding NtrC family response regulator
MPILRQGGTSTTARLPEPSIRRGNGETVAIIDDEESVALLTQQALEHYGYRPVVYNRARDCLGRLLDQPDAFQLVITDHTMPEMTGLELIKALRAVGSQVPVLMFSGYGRDLDATEFARFKRFAFLGKPFELGALLREVHRLLQVE